MEAPILIVEDNDEDYEVMVRAIRRAGVNRSIDRAIDGNTALQYIANAFTQESRLLPVFVTLDINLPGIDGRTVLARIKADPRLRALPVIMLTTSHSPRDIMHCYELGANAYMRKPVDLPRFYQSIAAMCAYWLVFVVAPDPAARNSDV